MCIEVSASFSFPNSINVTVLNEESREEIIVPIEVEYQSRPPSCPICKVFGHSPLKCPKSNFKWVPKAQNPGDSNVAEAIISGLEGLEKSTKAGTSPPASISTDPITNILVPVNNEWVTVSRGAKNDKDPATSMNAMITTNTFSLIADSGTLVMFDNDSPCADNPLVTRLKVVDEIFFFG